MLDVLGGRYKVYLDDGNYKGCTPELRHIAGRVVGSCCEIAVIVSVVVTLLGLVALERDT